MHFIVASFYLVFIVSLAILVRTAINLFSYLLLVTVIFQRAHVYQTSLYSLFLSPSTTLISSTLYLCITVLSFAIVQVIIIIISDTTCTILLQFAQEFNCQNKILKTSSPLT